MTVCMILSYGMCDKGTLLFLIPMFIGVTFFCVADHCYSKTIYKLKDEIRELQKKIDSHIK
jgi:hypothetical protein